MDERQRCDGGAGQAGPTGTGHPAAPGGGARAATVARMYDYWLGGIHNFPADQEAARQVMAQFPFAPVVARANRAFLGRAVRYLAGAGVRQYLDLGSGIPTAGNVHEIAQAACPAARVVYVDIDPVAVAESQEILDGNQHAAAVRADLCDPEAVLGTPQVRDLLDFAEPVAVLLASVMHFVADDEVAYGLVGRYVDALVPDSYLVLSHGAAEIFDTGGGHLDSAKDAYRRHAAITGSVRGHADVERFFTGLDLVDPGVVWLNEWHARPHEIDRPADGPVGGGEWCGVGRKK